MSAAPISNDLPFAPDSIPRSLRELDQWVLWTYGPQRPGGKRSKLPKTPLGGNAKVNDASTWSAFDECLGAFDGNSVDGIGFVLSDEDSLVAIDLDGCVDDNGKVSPSALGVVRSLSSSYWEVSPSGRGLHGFVLGVLPAAVKHRLTLEDGTGFEIYQAGRYLTVTGKHVKGTGAEVARCGEALRQTLRTAGAVEERGDAHSVTGSVERIVRSLSEREDFRALYFDGDCGAYGDDKSRADLALANMLAAASDFDPEVIDQAFRKSALMRAKWDARHAADGSTYGQLTILKACDVDDDNVSSAECVSSESLWKRTCDRPALDSAALYGLAGDVVRIVGERSEGSSAAILSTFLAAFGNAVGQGPYCKVGSILQKARLFFVHVGETAKARKGQTFSDAVHCVKNADPAWHDEAYVTGIGSGEGLMQKLSDETRAPRGENAGSKDGEINVDSIQDPTRGLRAFIYETEFARLLIVAAREGSTLSPIIREAWDSNRLQLQVRKNAVVVNNAHISIIGQITIDELRRELRESSISDGFANRFLFVSTYRAQLLPRGGDFDSSEVHNLVERVRTAIARAQSIERVEFADNAGAEWDRRYAISNSETNTPVGLVGALLAREDAQLLRLALAYALTDGSDRIEMPHLRAAEALWNYCAASARYVFGEMLGDDLAQRLLDEIREVYPQGLSRDEQFQKVGRHISAAKLAVARDTLLRLGLARSERQKNRGRTRDVLFAVAPNETEGRHA